MTEKQMQGQLRHLSRNISPDKTDKTLKQKYIAISGLLSLN